MHGNLSTAGSNARKSNDRDVKECPLDDRFGVDAEYQWFSSICRRMWNHKPGLALHLETDCGERNGHRYSSGEVAVPSYVVRMLLRSKNGSQWLNAIMDGCDQEWWREHKRAERITLQVDRIDLS